MKLINNVQSNVYPQIEVKSTFVRVPIDVKTKVEIHGELETNIFVYDEEIYGKDEYIELLNEKINKSNSDLEIEIMKLRK